MTSRLLQLRLLRAAAGLALVIAGAAAATRAGAQATVPPIPAGEARIWIYRVFFPDDTPDMPAVSANGTPIGYALAGTSFYRDLPAGRYRLSVASEAADVHDGRDVVLAPGQQLYVKIDSDPYWDGSSLGSWRRGAHFIRIAPPQLAALELRQTRVTAGN